MPANSPLGISFSPFNQDVNGGSQTGLNPSSQEPIQIRNLRLPRVIGAGAPVAAPLLNAPGGAAFGPAGGNLEQLLAILYGMRRPMLPGGGSFNERPDLGGASIGNTLFGSPQTSQPVPAESPLPWDRSAPLPRTTFNQPGAGEEYKGPPPETLTGPNGSPYQPPSAGALPWENSGPTFARGDRRY